MRRLLIAVVMLATMAQADGINYKWTHATTRVDGNPITGQRHYVLTIQHDSDPEFIVETAGTSHLVDPALYGTYTARIATVEDGLRGAESLPVIVDVKAPPVAPKGLTGDVTYNVDMSGSTINVTIGQ